jgi:hypothetical protein
MSKIDEFFQADPDWLAAKAKANKIKSDRLLTKLEFLKILGRGRFTEDLYKKYCQDFRAEEKPPEFIFKTY